jgi:hypothetical protein
VEDLQFQKIYPILFQPLSSRRNACLSGMDTNRNTCKAIYLSKNTTADKQIKTSEQIFIVIIHHYLRLLRKYLIYNWKTKNSIKKQITWILIIVMNKKPDYLDLCYLYSTTVRSKDAWGQTMKFIHIHICLLAHQGSNLDGGGLFLLHNILSSRWDSIWNRISLHNYKSINIYNIHQ